MRKLLFIFLLASTSVAQAVCTTATINQTTAQQQIRLQMTSTQVSALLGCNPVELPAPAGTAASTLLAWGINDGVYRKQISVDFAREEALPAPGIRKYRWRRPGVIKTTTATWWRSPYSPQVTMQQIISAPVGSVFVRRQQLTLGLFNSYAHI